MHNYLLYYLIILPLSRLPFRVLYVLSDILYFFIYCVFGYRKKVVRTNLSKSFPEKTAQEIKNIEEKFYHHLCDLMVESIKIFTISHKEASRRMITRNPELPNRFFDAGKSLAVVGGHYGNWELYAVTVAGQIKHKAAGLYTPLNNKFFDEKMYKSRSKFGLNMWSVQRAKEQAELHRDDLTAVIFGADQCPRASQKAYRMTFLNQDTGVQFGVEKFARDYRLPVIFGNIYKMKRGYYEVEYSLVCEDPDKLPLGAITEAHTRMLEKVIMACPEYWLWSHKRWKR